MTPAMSLPIGKYQTQKKWHWMTDAKIKPLYLPHSSFSHVQFLPFFKIKNDSFSWGNFYDYFAEYEIGICSLGLHLSNAEYQHIELT